MLSVIVLLFVWIDLVRTSSMSLGHHIKNWYRLQSFCHLRLILFTLHYFVTSTWLVQFLFHQLKVLLPWIEHEYHTFNIRMWQNVDFDLLLLLVSLVVVSMSVAILGWWFVGWNLIKHILQIKENTPQHTSFSISLSSFVIFPNCKFLQVLWALKVIGLDKHGLFFHGLTWWCCPCGSLDWKERLKDEQFRKAKEKRVLWVWLCAYLRRLLCMINFRLHHSSY